MQAFIDMAKAKNFPSLTTSICATGGGAFKFEADFKQVSNTRYCFAATVIAIATSSDPQELQKYVDLYLEFVCSFSTSYEIVSYHIVDLKRQHRLKVGTNKPKLKVKMQSVSDDDVRKRFLEQPRFELVYSDWEDVTSFGRAF